MDVSDMTKKEMIKEIFDIADISCKEKSEQVDKAYERFLRKPKNMVEMHYNAVIKSKVTACFSIAVASGIFFKEHQQVAR